MNKQHHGLVAVCALFSVVAAPAFCGADEIRVVPEQEKEIATKQQAHGPTENKGVRSVASLGAVALEHEFEGMAEYVLRAREITVDPGGVVAVHQHEKRPGLAYILEGEIVEHRSDASEPLARKVGAVAFEKTGVTHWWENRTDTPVRALVVDIVPTEKGK